MLFLTTIVPFVLGVASASAVPSKNYVDWKTFKGTGLNLGGWLAQEAVIDPVWYVKEILFSSDTLKSWN